MHPRFFTLALLVSAPFASAAVYVSDFSGSVPGQVLDGFVDNGTAWTQSEANLEADSPLAWIGDVAGSAGASVGGYYNPPVADSFYAARAIGSPLASSTLALNFGIQDSTTLYQDRNDFSITVASGAGDNLFTLGFSATSQSGDYDNPLAPADPGTSNALWNVSWSSDLAGGATNFAAVGEDALYFMVLNFTPNGGDMDFDLSLQGAVGSPFIQAGSLTGAAAENFSELRLGFDKGAGTDYGDNLMVIQGVVPEPGSMLLLGLSAIGLLRRRR